MRNLYLNYSAILILLSLLILSHMKGKGANPKIRWLYLAIVIDGLISTLSSTIYVLLDDFLPDFITARYLFHTIYLISHNYITVFYCAYLVGLTDTWHKYAKHKFILIFSCIPIVVVTILLLLNSFTPIIYYFDQNQAYKRVLPNFILLYICAAFYMCYGLLFIFKFRKIFPKKVLITVTLVFPAMALAAIFELILTGVVIENFFNSMALLFVSANIQRSEETLESSTGFGNTIAFRDDIKKAEFSSKEIIQILINVTNYRIIQETIGYNYSTTLSKKIADHITSLERTFKLDIRNYYIGEGLYRLIIPGKHYEATCELAQYINTFFKQAFTFNDIQYNLITVICVERNPEDIADIDTSFIFANELNNSKYYTGEILYANQLYKNDYYQKLRNIDQILENAIINNKFEVYYQPIYSIKEQRFNSAEALIRLYDDEYGFISPEFFIPAAERSGAIFKITNYVLTEVCKFVASKEFEDLEIDYIEVNLSAAECMQENLTTRIMNILGKYKVPTSKINIEITETALSTSEEKLYENLSALEKEGITISLDDFGSGYSNLQRLTRLPLHLVKFDKSFIYNIENQNIKTIMLRNLSKMIHEMKLKILIEGVETADVFDYFDLLGMDYVQGYYFSKPITKKDFIKFIQRETFPSD